jgi:uncharacterized membrane protein YdjX (TVP38/TMEM64 family)
MIRQLLPLLLFAALFIAVSVLAERYHAALGVLVTQGGILSIAAYVLLTAVFVIFVIPLDIAFLIPLGAVAWGAIPTALMSIAGWTLGAAAAFLIARRFGEPVVARLIGLERIRAVELRIPKQNLFWIVALLRIFVSVDILSYALGLFSSMPLGAYLVATAIGVTPFGFYFAYTGVLPLGYRIVAVMLALALATFVIVRYGVRREP